MPYRRKKKKRFYFDKQINYRVWKNRIWSWVVLFISLRCGTLSVSHASEKPNAQKWVPHLFTNSTEYTEQTAARWRNWNFLFSKNTQNLVLKNLKYERRGTERTLGRKLCTSRGQWWLAATSRKPEGNAVIPERTMEKQKKRKKQHPRKRERLSEGSVTGDAQGGLSTFGNLIF